MNTISLLSIIGLIISIYTVHVKNKLKNNGKYKAICDFKENISCTKALSSKYGKIIGFSNSYVGIIFYILVFILNYFEFTDYLFYLSSLAFLGSLYLAYLSYVKMKNFCLVCTAIYLINFLLLFFSYINILRNAFV